MSNFTRNTPVCLLSCLMILLSLSCKKEEESTTKSYLDGYLQIDASCAYCNIGDIVSFKLKGVSYPSTDTDTTHKLGAYYSVSPSLIETDTICDPSVNPYKSSADFTLVMPDSLTSFTITATIYPTASTLYYSTSASTMITVVDSLESIPEISPYISTKADSLYTDKRDGHVYACVRAGGLTWMNRNLSYLGTSDDPVGIPYASHKCMNYIFGTYYTWDEAQRACPPGWRLPSSAEWDALGQNAGDLMADATFNIATKLWEYWPEVKITDSYGLSLIPSGYLNPVSRKSSGELEYAAFWTKDEETLGGTSYGVYRYVYVKDNDVKRALLEKGAVAMSVRCVK